jgi:hypothetical protein
LSIEKKREMISRAMATFTVADDLLRLGHSATAGRAGLHGGEGLQ